ncbi:Alpha-D-kanosaminyltransferase [Paracoccus haematequi]|uniref:Alpha-D-kanosaminyltransferase n=1 Tax=Paracoccus haematequi TaxID=2491866 RepID=A0A447IQG5_9RHOB|nr:glycosyltransferase [Paracoccus haematequi]VDS09785.1 Alpha-D-kanosaminyltransferase [Paracoccus haematequi]
MRCLLLTDSPEPSGLGEHMLTLAASLPPGMAFLGFPDHPAGRALAARAADRGVLAQVFDPRDAGPMIAASPARIVHIHAGIGWEGHDLVAAAAQAGRAVIRTEHLPWLLTDGGQIDAYAQASRDLDAVIAVSQAAGRGWRAALDGMARADLPVHAVPNGTAPPPVPYQGGDGMRLLCVGRFAPQKLHRTLLVALARLHRRGIPARLDLAGPEPGDPCLTRWAARLGLGDSLAILGRRDDVAALMAASDLLVLPSGFEGLPLVLLEAMSIGLPVVATDVPGSAEALGPDHPWLVPPRRSRPLADAVAQALTDRPGREAVARGGRDRWTRHFTAARMAADTMQVYRRVLRQRNEDGMTKTRLGFIGAGGIAHRHFGVLRTMEDVHIAALCDPDRDRAAQAARDTGAVAYADHDAMLAAEDLDAVFICVPPFAHGAPERACIDKGLPFFVEKPISLDVALAQDIAAQVEAAGLITAVGYHWRYLDTMDEARGHLARNAPHLIQGFWLDQTPPPQWWWHDDKSGGQVVEQATHVIDAARFLAGDVTEVFAMSARRDRDDFAGLTVPTATAATLRFASGAIANLSATCLLRWNHRVGLHVFADGMALEISDHDLMVDVGQGRPLRPAQGDPVWREDRDFIEAVQGRENRIRCPYGEALITHRVALAVAQSARDGALVKMEGLRADPQPIFRQASAQSPDHAA